MHNRNFGRTELDVALHKCNSGISLVKVKSVVRVSTGHRNKNKRFSCSHVVGPLVPS